MQVYVAVLSLCRFVCNRAFAVVIISELLYYRTYYNKLEVLDGQMNIASFSMKEYFHY